MAAVIINIWKPEAGIRHVAAVIIKLESRGRNKGHRKRQRSNHGTGTRHIAAGCIWHRLKLKPEAVFIQSETGRGNKANGRRQSSNKRPGGRNTIHGSKHSFNKKLEVRARRMAADRTSHSPNI